MKFAEFRDKITSFLVPILIVALVFWGLIWLIGTTFFWDTSRLTIDLPTEDPVTAEIELQARLIYEDFLIFGISYPLHITFPTTYSRTCEKRCIFDNLAPGDGIVRILGSTGEIIEILQIRIDPDTDGMLDLRKKLTFSDVVESFTPPTDLPSTPTFSNYADNIYLFTSWAYSLYDGNTKQSISLAMLSSVPLAIARTEKDGEFLLWNGENMYRFDRYGRSPLTKIDSITRGNLQISWTSWNTELASLDERGALDGIWFPTGEPGALILTNGQEMKQVTVLP